MTTILKREFKTPLGVVEMLLQSDKADDVLTIDDKLIKTLGHEIRLETIKLRNEWTPNIMAVDTSIGWRWFLTKRNGASEQLIISCKLTNPDPATEWGPNPGEHLDSVEIENETHHLHIGTEDGDIMQGRARQKDWMPARFERLLGIKTFTEYSFTEYIDFGFKTTVPELNESEQIYFHFLLATNPNKPSDFNPNERDCSTWFAVDQSKSFLDQNANS